MSKTLWTPNASLDATAEPYDSSTVAYDSASEPYDGIDPTKEIPSLTSWTNVSP